MATVQEMRRMTGAELEGALSGSGIIRQEAWG